MFLKMVTWLFYSFNHSITGKCCQTSRGIISQFLVRLDAIHHLIHLALWLVMLSVAKLDFFVQTCISNLLYWFSTSSLSANKMYNGNFLNCDLAVWERTLFRWNFVATKVAAGRKLSKTFCPHHHIFTCTSLTCHKPYILGFCNESPTRCHFITISCSCLEYCINLFKFLWIGRIIMK